MAEKQRRLRELRVKDFVAESLREIANHSSEAEALPQSSRRRGCVDRPNDGYPPIFGRAECS